MKSLYVANCRPLSARPGQDVSKWSSIFEMVYYGTTLIDRTDHIIMPYRFKTHSAHAMPENTGKAKTYEECCIDRATQLVELSRRLDKRIVVFYSGGIDSTTVLISFMKVLTSAELSDRIVVALTLDSIHENPRFYYDHIRTKCNVVSSESMTKFISKDFITVGGEHNDQLFGSDILLKMNYYSLEDKFRQPIDKDYLVGWFARYMSVNDAGYWVTLLLDQIKSSARCEVATNYDFFWWYNFCFKWQNVYFRMLYTLGAEKRALINDDFLETYYHQFFSSADFQLWSMNSHHLKIGNSWKDYKLESKKFIHEFNGDAEYLKDKIKIGSLINLFNQRGVVQGISDSFEFIESLNPEEFYNPDNSFIDISSQKGKLI